MTRGRGQKYYAVSIGRDGPMIYLTWDECKAKVSRFPGSVFKSFSSRQEAEQWLTTRAPHSDPAPEPQNQSLLDPPCVLPDPEPSSTGPPPKAEIALSRDQQRILDHVKQGRSVFFTGSAGTGKSVLLRAIIDNFGGRPSQSLAITASTGIAAVNIGGCTLHSWAGIGLGKESVKNLSGKFLYQMKYEPVKRRWQGVRTLILDERGTCSCDEKK
ncbi:PIF1-like helicase-domain-containing protein [Amanita rubescens]|nr:PIF1-like helicase-domain-containing protein [Amanita rubescens]